MGIYPGDSPNPQLPIFDFEKRNLKKNQQQLKDQQQQKQKNQKSLKKGRGKKGSNHLHIFV